MELVIGDKLYSTWSMRPWLVLKRIGVPFDEVHVKLRQPSTAEAIAAHSPSGQVPVLKDGDFVLWDSLAICEHLADRYPDAKLWPDDPIARAFGRAAAAEMHGGFASLRGECPMDLSHSEVATLSEATQKNVRRIARLWSDLRGRFGAGGPFLLGQWSIADAFYTPVATRFRSYGVHLSDYGDLGPAGAYCEALLETPEFLEWRKGAMAEVA
jgi:glutathione S-transferase